MLTGGSWFAACLLIGTSGLAWITAAILAWRRATLRARSDIAAFAVGAAIVVVCWVQVLPQHTAFHGAFMVRILIVPIALSWAALIWLVLVPCSPRRT